MAKLSGIPGSADHYERLKVLVQVLADAIDECESKRDLAALSKRYLDASRELETAKPHEKTAIDEMVERHRGCRRFSVC